MKFIGTLFTAATLFCLTTLVLAQDENNVIQLGGGPWKATEKVELPNHGFDVYYSRGSFYFSGVIEMKPVITFQSGAEQTTFSLALNVSAKVTNENPLPDTYLWLGYRLARQVMDYPEQSVHSIVVYFDKGEPVTYGGWNTPAPEKARAITRIDVAWHSNDLELQRTLIWGGAGFPWVKAVAGGAATLLSGIGGALFYRRRLRKKQESREEDRNEIWEIRFRGIDPEWELDHVNPGQVIHVWVRRITEVEGGGEAPSSIMVVNISTGNPVSLSLESGIETTGVYLSEPLLLQWPGESLKIVGKHLKMDYGHWLCAMLENDRTSIAASGRPEEVIPDMPGFRLERKGDDRRLQVNPDLNRDGSLVVRLIDTQGEGVAGERIQWRIDRFPEAVITATDDYGETALSFSPMRDGRFAAMFDGLLLAEGVPAGDLSITAVPADESFLGLMETEPVQFTARLTPPTIVDILDANFSAVPLLLDRQEYYLQTLTGGGGRGGFLRPRNINGSLTLPDGDSEAVILEKTSRRWLYCSAAPREVRVDDEGDELIFSCHKIEARVPVYKTDISAQWHEFRKMFEALGATVEHALRQSELDTEHRAQLEIKADLVKNALIWHGQDFKAKIVNLAILDKYRELLLDEDLDYGERIDASPDQRVLPVIAKNIQLRYVCEAEQSIIDSVVDDAVKHARGSLTVLDGIFIIMLESVRALLSAHIGAYVLITGRTEEGERASTMERLMGGIEVLLVLAPVGIVAARYARAARAMRMQARAELRLIDRTLSQAYDHGLFTLAEVSAKQLERRFKHLFRKSSKKSDRLLARIEGIDNRVTTLRDKVANHRGELEKAEDQLRQMEYQRTLPPKSRTPGIKTTPSAIASKKKGIQQRREWLEGAVQELDGELAKHREVTDALDAIEAGRYLDRQELLRMHEAKVLPAAHDKFDGIPAWQLFEKQTEGAFAATDPRWAGNNKVFIREPYRRTNWGKKFSINEKVKTRHPEPDHLRIDPDNFSAGDSKFYFWPEGNSLESLSRSGRRKVEKHVTTIVDTIEKARLSQFHLVQGTARMSGAPANKVWKEVFDLPMVIVTPSDVPKFARNMIKSRVRGAGRNVVFTTLKPSLDIWADLIPKAGKGN